MTTNSIGRLRLANQRIAQPHPGALAELVSHMGALQAQDYAAVKFAAALRLKQAPAEAEIEGLIASKEVLRVWSLRGTIHLLPAQDAAWIVRLVGRRPQAAGQRILESEGFGPAEQAKSLDVLHKALAGGHLLPRNELYARLEEAGLATSAQRGYHLLAHAGVQGHLCIGPLQGKQPTFAWLADWAPNPTQFSPEAALTELARRYFRSHGPARLEDWAWWSGLSLSEARAAHAALGAELVEERHGEQVYWRASHSSQPAAGSVHLLPAFDEFVVGYQERSPIVPQGLAAALMPYKNGLIQAVLVADGQVLGTWKRTLVKDKLTIELAPFAGLSATVQAGATAAAQAYAHYLGATLHKLNGLR